MNGLNRMPVRLRGSLALSDGRIIPVIVAELSDSGCRVECTEVLPIGVPFQLEVAGRDRTCVSERWSTVGKAALVFI